MDGVVLLVALMLGAAVVAVRPRPSTGGRSARALAHSIVCAVARRLRRGDAALAAPTGGRRRARAAASRRTSSTSRARTRCRSTSAAAARTAAPTRPTTRTSTRRAPAAGAPAAAFTHVVHRAGRRLSPVLVLLPRLDTVLGPSSAIWNNSPLVLAGRYPASIADDWEGYQVRVGAVRRGLGARHLASRLPGVQAEPVPEHVDRSDRLDARLEGSHAGHIPLETAVRHATDVRPRSTFPHARDGYRPLIPDVDLHERTTSGAGLDLIPIEAACGLQDTTWDGNGRPG